MSVSDVTKLTKLSFNHPSIRLTANVFHLRKRPKPVSIADPFRITFSLVSTVDLQHYFLLAFNIPIKASEFLNQRHKAA